jgi:Fic family protein
MQNILRAIALKKELDALRPLDKAQEEKIMQKFRLDWNYHSNHLEGNSLTFGETKNLILHGITAQGKPFKDHIEITGHNEAINWLLEIINGEIALTEKFIRELHVLLLKEPYEVTAITPNGLPSTKRVEVGKYKTTANHLKTNTGEIFRFAEPEETAALMTELLDWYKTKSSEADTNPIILASEFHYKFIRIHPFDDGNGRTVRILLNFILMRFGYPPVIIKTEDKLNYFFALRQADKGDFEFFADYIGKNLIRSIELMIAGNKGESIEEPDDLDKNIALLEQRLKGIEKPASKLKSKENIRNILIGSFKSIYKDYFYACEKFKSFYFKTQFYVMMSSFTNQGDLNFDKIIEEFDKQDNVDKIILAYSYTGLTQEGHGEFGHFTSLTINFKETLYEINNIYQTIDKPYSLQLSKPEINELINSISEKHTQFIKQRITEFESKNKDSK